MIKNPVSLSIFFPAFNEEENIIGSIEQAIAVAEHSPFISDYEVIVVNDGSTDHTRQVSEAFAKTNDKVRVVTHNKNRGAGASLATGFASATKDYVFYTDADLQFDIKEVNSLLLHIDAADIVVGYRAPRRDPFMRLVNAKGWNILIRTLFGLKVRDVDCAFKVFPTKLVQQHTYKAKGAMTLAEIMIRVTRAGATVKEIPVTHMPRVAGSPTGAKLSVIVVAFREMIELYLGELGLVSQKQALRFMCVGVINTLVDFIIYIGLTRFTPGFAGQITLAKLFAFMGGTVSSFLLNRTWTFQMRTKINFAEVVRFYSVISLSLIVNLVVMAFLTSYLGIYDLVALLITTVFTFAASFTLARAWVFIKDTTVQVPKVIHTEFPQL
jgi:glycosyltransferase involved in cell wall biosynthesis